MKARFLRRVLSVFIFAVCFSACESSPGPLYSWGSYELQVYAYLNGESRGEQLTALERDLEKIEADGKAVPPGFYAHLGLLHVDMGNAAEAVYCFTMEKTLFPEAVVFMDFLLANYGR